MMTLQSQPTHKITCFQYWFVVQWWYHLAIDAFCEEKKNCELNENIVIDNKSYARDTSIVVVHWTQAELTELIKVEHWAKWIFKLN